LPRTELAVSAGEILQLIRTNRVSTRRDLQELTGLSRSTLSLRLAQLSAAGYIRVSGERPGTAGRPAGVLSFDPTDKLVLAANLGATHAVFALTDAAGHVLAQVGQELPIASGPEPVLKATLKRFRELLRTARRPASQLVGVGVGVPGPVDFSVGRPLQPPIMPGWHDYPLAEHVSKALAVPAYVDNDANVMGVGEARTCHPDVPSLLFVKVATGIGAGVILHGTPERGATGAAGDLGHVRIAHTVDGQRCACGSTGCLAAHASGAALAQQLADRGVRAQTSRDVMRLAQAGQPDAVALVRTAGQLLGEVLATAVALLNPAVLVVGGDMAHTHEHFLIGVRESLYRRTVPLATRNLLITASELGDRAGILGAVHMVVDQVFSVEEVDKRLTERVLTQGLSAGAGKG
jgi:predicted NBD/HSP70 family sugar kinase